MLTLEQKSKNFTTILTSAAEALGSVFFEDSGESNWLETDSLFLEDVSGWLIPFDRKDEFATVPRENRWDDKWDDFFCFAEWHMEGDKIVVEFNKHD